MKRLIVVTFVIGILLIIFLTERRKEVVVSMTTSGFTPNIVTIRRGDTVVFINRDAIDHWPASNYHPTHDLYPAFDPTHAIGSGKAWTFRFDQMGTWYFHDHLESTMGGKIIVTDGSKASRTVFAPKEKGKAWIEKIERERDETKQQALVRELAYTVGPTAALELFTASNLPRSGATHLLAHRIGEVAYELFGDEALLSCKNDMFNGCSHGVILTATSEGGFERIRRMVARCQEKHTPFQYHMCLHGAGHAFLTLADYAITPALANCDRLVESTRPESIHCYNGVFMENVLGDHGGLVPALHPDLSPVDLHKPCATVSSQYKLACYFNQASWWYTATHQNIEKTVEQCKSVPSDYKGACADSVGRVIATVGGRDVQKLVALCSLLGEPWSTSCITAIAKATFAVGDDELPFTLCRSIVSSEGKKMCYTDLMALFTEQQLAPERLKDLCRRIEGDYQYLCTL